MHFKLDFTVRHLTHFEGFSLKLSFSVPHEISVQLWQPTPDEQDNGFVVGDVFGLAKSQCEPNPRVRAMFESLASGRLPDGSTKDSEWVGRSVDEDGNILPGNSALWDALPQSFRSFASGVTDELWDYARRTVRIVRWRKRTEGVHAPFGWRGASWSFDGIDWHMLPSTLRAYFSTSQILTSLTGAEHEEIRELVQQGHTEPLGHELYREAWEQRFENPRSALILGIVAAEAGFKQLVADLIPAARWLAEEAPSPPLTRMLVEYLPLLPTRNTIGGKVLPPPPAIIEALKKGVLLRNQLAHRGVSNFETDTLYEVLSAVRDVLWLLDYYNGFDWALGYLTHETRQSLRA